MLALVAWMAVLVVTDVDQDQQLHQAEARAGNLALVFEEQIYRQVLSIDQTLRSLKLDWERDPGGFDLAPSRAAPGALSDIISQLIVADAHGRVAGQHPARRSRRRRLGARRSSRPTAAATAWAS